VRHQVYSLYTTHTPTQTEQVGSERTSVGGLRWVRLVILMVGTDDNMGLDGLDGSAAYEERRGEEMR
jgi:hypothetical protein